MPGSNATSLSSTKPTSACAPGSMSEVTSSVPVTSVAPKKNHSRRSDTTRDAREILLDEARALLR